VEIAQSTEQPGALRPLPHGQWQPTGLPYAQRLLVSCFGVAAYLEGRQSNALPNNLRARLIAGSPCIVVEAHLICRPWHRERQSHLRDFGTAGICRRPRIAHSRHQPKPPHLRRLWCFSFSLPERRRVWSGLSNGGQPHVP
jgi:hypothetical protein